MKTCAQMTIKEELHWFRKLEKQGNGPKPHLTEAGGKRKELQLLG